MVSISILNLTKRFARQTVLNQVSLEIEQGELFFLLGPSGCGKTTLLRHIAGFYEPDSGQIFFGPHDVTNVPPHERHTGMMFQSYALWPHLNVNENVAFGLEERSVPKSEIDHMVRDALEMVQLDGLGKRRIAQLSGGQQQRVALARALVIRPQVFLLDEPLSNLDAKLRLEMRSEIRRLCKQFGLTGIYVTHDREEALAMGDRLAVMDGGKIMQVGSPMEVYRHPANQMVAEFMGETNLIPGTVGRPCSREGLHDVETAAGVIRGRPSGDDFIPVQGQQVLLSIRPEALTFGLVGDTPNRFFGHVASATYLGSTVQYQMECAGGVTLKMSELNPMFLREPDGEQLRMMVSTRDVVILRR
ncbi:MAG: ABC transporter ATP-binding protein [Verrucomicrobiaceae bacterium]|nr:ABC transporter ATP-binding protein [Verrucomicrobiaceae bacterium]